MAEWRVVPATEVHERWCSVPDAMERDSVVSNEDPRLAYDWYGVCLHGRVVTGMNEEPKKAGRPSCNHPARNRSKKTGQCLICNRIAARRYRNRDRHENPPVSAGQRG